jgi:hypothetical protein
MKANIEFLQKLINLPDQYPPKPIDISNQIQINFDPLAQYRQLQELSKLSHSNDYHYDFSYATPLPKHRPREDYKQKGGATNKNTNDSNVQLHFLHQRDAVTDPGISDDNEPPPLRSRRYDDSSDDSSDDEDESPPRTTHEENDENVHYDSPTDACKPTRRAFIKHAFVEAANLSCDLSPLSPEEDHCFTPTKLTIYHSCNAGELPIVIDSGASVTVTPVLSDFVGHLRASRLTSLQGLSAKSIIIGEGTICWSVRDSLGQLHQLRTKAYYVPDAKICLFSPQQ